MAKLKAVVDSLDDLEEHFHELYTEKDGKYLLTGIEGIKTQADIDRVTRALNQEKEAHKKTKEKVSSLGNYLDDIPSVVEKLDKWDEVSAAASGKLDDEKINGIVETRVKSKLTPLEREKKTLSERNAELERENNELRNKERTRVIREEVRREAIASKMIETAVEDALLMAERVFELNEEGEVLTKDGVSPKDWLVDMQPKRPHWWPASVGGGARNGNGGGSLVGNPWTADNWNFTAQAKIAAEDPTRAERLAKAAGSSVGATKPPSKK